MLKQARQAAFDRFDGRSPFVQEDLSKNIPSLLSTIMSKPLVIGGYCEMGSEFPFSLLMKQISAWCEEEDISVSYAYPHIGSNQLDSNQSMDFITVDKGDDLQLSDFGFKQPVYDKHNIAQPDLIFVPALGFDYAGNRLGYGKGHYDRYFASLNDHASVMKVGLNYAHILDTVSLMVDALPSDVHDVKMDYILTEAGLYKTHL